MENEIFVIVFPSIFGKNKTKTLISNIKKILKIRNLKFESITVDDDVIVVKVDDPVIASSTINTLFGIKQVAIANKIENKFDLVISQINKIGKNLILKGEKFLVKVEGNSKGYLPKDVEIASTGKIIESTSNLGIKPGTETKHDKLLYTYLTKSNAYTCIFVDQGLNGIPNDFHNAQVLCCIYDELSALNVIETIKEGFTGKLIICYRDESDLQNLIKILNQILPFTLQPKIELEFLPLPTNLENYFHLVDVITQIAIEISKTKKITHVSLPITPLIFPVKFSDELLQKVFKNSIIPITPLSGLDEDILKTARQIGITKFLSNIQRLQKVKLQEKKINVQKIVQDAIKSKQKISIKLGANNIHDILDSLGLEH
ncbi:thiamine biosynthesis protein [Nitrosopumilus sp. b1]|uniref:thiamine biosynthesis protein n=1 Tax=Nitrosopumilus sp. b1 TaxID=2109907 RepID=UPI0015F74A85|nr:thiamine biosynthesis protein [Nitrosopumilus sp. b1]KAF6243583.1 thiamine biosynthesis protein [Nitrosopumilus sp. b1]